MVRQGLSPPYFPVLPENTKSMDKMDNIHYLVSYRHNLLSTTCQEIMQKYFLKKVSTCEEKILSTDIVLDYSP